MLIGLKSACGCCKMVDHGADLCLQVTLYEESLCPYCRRYIHRILSPLFRNGLSDFVDLHIVAVGNAIKVGEGELKCQHGPEECVGNRIINCAIHLHPQPKIWFPFVDCLERGQNFTSRAEKCAQKVVCCPFRWLYDAFWIYSSCAHV